MAKIKKQKKINVKEKREKKEMTKIKKREAELGSA